MWFRFGFYIGDMVSEAANKHKGAAQKLRKSSRYESFAANQCTMWFCIGVRNSSEDHEIEIGCVTRQPNKVVLFISGIKL